MTYLGLGDLLARWKNYSRVGILKLRKKSGFPEPVLRINAGRTPVWDETDIKLYELFHPELLDPEEKRKKVRSFAIGQLKKRTGGS